MDDAASRRLVCPNLCPLLSMLFDSPCCALGRYKGISVPGIGYGSSDLVFGKADRLKGPYLCRKTGRADAASHSEAAQSPQFK